MAKEGFVSIHGKEYETVASRVNRFRETYGVDMTIMTRIVKIDADECIVEASILNEQSRIIANGHAQEFRIASQINKTSYVENCETSAIGRALAAFGIGGTEFASANEVVNAIHQQNTPVIKLPALTDAEAEREYHKWMQTKSLCVDGDGDPSIEKQNEAWFKLPSNIRSAITRYGKSIALSQEIDANAKEHIKNI